MKFQIGRYKNVIMLVLLALLFFEVLVIFPQKIEKHNEYLARKTVGSGQLQDSDHPAPPDDSGELKAEQKMKGVQLSVSPEGARDWELFAESAVGNQGKGVWNLHKVKVLFYKNEKTEYTVTGDEGAIDSRNLQIRGHVITRSANGYSFQTETVFYDDAHRQITSPGDVQMLGPNDSQGDGMVLKGSNMEVMVDQSKMSIHGKVSAERNMRDQKKLKIQSDGAEFNGKNKEALFKGKVVMYYDKLKIEGPQAQFVYSAKDSLLSTIQVMGGTKVSDLDKFASSDKLDIDVLNNQFTFRGSPRLIQNDDELTGDEITFLDGGKRVKVNKVKAHLDK